MSIYILGIESSCDDTSAAVLRDNEILSNYIATQKIHENFGGVVPELASRAHQQNIIPVVHTALQNANITKNQLSAIAFTLGPGLPGSLMVGISFAKSLSMSLGIKLIDVNHMQAHVLANFLRQPGEENREPRFPFLCLTVSGGHTQIVKVNSPLDMEVVGNTIDDAAGETFDKAAKILGLPYPGGPVIDKLSNIGNPKAFKFSKPKTDGLNFSFSGLKTSFLYTIRDHLKNDEHFIEKNVNDLASSIQYTIIDILADKIIAAAKQFGISQIAMAGGVSANAGLRKKLTELGEKYNWDVYYPKISYTTDNAAMIAMAGYFKYKENMFCDINAVHFATGSTK